VADENDSIYQQITLRRAEVLRELAEFANWVAGGGIIDTVGCGRVLALLAPTRRPGHWITLMTPDCHDRDTERWVRLPPT
jgi:hypothetical protein